MSLPINKPDLKKNFNKDLRKIGFLTTLTTTLLIGFIIFFSLSVVISPVLAAESKNKNTVKNQASFFDKLNSFVKSPFTTVALAASTPAPKQTKQIKQGPSLLGQIWNFITAPYRALVAAPKANPSSRTVATSTPRPAPVKSGPASSPLPSSIPATIPTTITSPSTTTAGTAFVVTALNAGVTYVDLIGKTIIDSSGNIYPSGAALAQTNKPTLGTTTNKYYALNLYNFTVDKAGGITTVLGGGIVKSSSKGVLSSAAVELDSGDISGTLQAGHGGTGNTTYTVGDILYSATANSLSKLGIGSANQVMIVSSGIPAWSSTLSVTSVALGDGTAASPALNFSNDTDSGLWRIGTNNIALTTAGSAFSGISINASGNVGIGATGAGGSLVVATGNVGIGTTIPNAVLSVQGNVGIGYTGSSQAMPANGLAVRGNVGIGATTANSTLSIAGSAHVGALYQGTAAPSNGMFVDGNVGIGATTSNNPLDVWGNARIAGTISADGAATIGGTLGLTGAATLTSTLGVSGITTLSASNGALSFTGALPSLTSNASVFGLFAGGNVGVGTTANVLGKFTVRGEGTGTNIALQTYGSNLVQGLTALDNGNVGVGNTSPGAALGVNGAGLFGTFSSAAAPENGLAVSGNLGIGTTTTNSKLSVAGSAAIGNGANTFGNKVAPSNGLAVEGNVGIGATTANSALFVNGGIAVGNNMNVAAPSNGLIVQGNVGIGTSAAGFAFVVGTQAQSGQFIVDSGGNVGIGVSGPSSTYKLDVGGRVRATGFNGACTADGNYIAACNQDIAEVYLSSEDVVPGDVLSINTGSDNLVHKSSGGYDSNLIGIVSTSPGLILGYNGQDVYMGGDTSTYGQTADPRKPAVALTGKVPVKVSTENGPINSGDYLTSSSVAGVAMKATKAGVVIGSALQAYNGEGVGSVLVFVKLGYFNGSKISDIVDQSTALEGMQPNLSQQILAKLLADKQPSSSSELLTDRIAAGVEIITPQLTADSVILGAFKPLEGKNLTLTLGATQTFNINDDQNKTAISFDSQGNATFKGSVVANAIKANQIEGLTVLANEVITGKISSLLDRVSKVEQATSSAVLAAVSQPGLNTNELVKFNENGGLTINGRSEFKGPSVFAEVVEFIKNTIFSGDVSFIGRIFLPKDSVGTAVIRTGSDSVTISFARGYGSAPTVNVTPTMQAGNDGAGNDILNGKVRFVVQNVSGSGFTIKLNTPASADLVFSWTALATGGNQFTSTATAASASSPVQESPTVTPTPTPAPVVSPTPAPSASPVASSSPAPTPTPTATPEPSATATPVPSTTPEPVASPTPTP